MLLISAQKITKIPKEQIFYFDELRKKKRPQCQNEYLRLVIGCSQINIRLESPSQIKTEYANYFLFSIKFE